jgi:hypothetical protein
LTVASIVIPVAAAITSRVRWLCKVAGQAGLIVVHVEAAVVAVVEAVAAWRWSLRKEVVKTAGEAGALVAAWKGLAIYCKLPLKRRR